MFWLNTPNKALKNKVPEDSKDKVRIDEVWSVKLNRIAYSVSYFPREEPRPFLFKESITIWISHMDLRTHLRTPTYVLEHELPLVFDLIRYAPDMILSLERSCVEIASDETIQDLEKI